MLAIKKKTLLVVIVITVAAVLAVVGVVRFVTKAEDEYIQKYNQALRATLDENAHFLIEITVPHLSEKTQEYAEYYTFNGDFLRIMKYPLNDIYTENHWFVYKGTDYSYDVSGENIEVNMSSYIMPTTGIPHGIGASYYSVNGANVTYEETDTHYIYTYINNAQKNGTVGDRYLEQVEGGYTSAVSVAYLDKNWNLEKLEIRETWNVIDANGEKQERERTVIVTYYDMSDADIEKALEDEYKMIMTEVYGSDWSED